MKFYKITDEIFKAHLSLFIGSAEEFRKRMKEQDIDEEVKGNGMFILHEEKRFAMIWVKSLENMEDYLVLVHEAMHYTTRVLNSRGIDVCDHNTEMLAYYQEMILKKINEAVGIKIVKTDKNIGDKNVSKRNTNTKKRKKSGKSSRP